MFNIRRLGSTLFCIVIMVSITFLPVVKSWNEDDVPTRKDFVPGPYRDLSGLVEDLIAETENMTDHDNDGLPDRVERIIGTDPFDDDTDGDKLNDMEEVNLNTDPHEIDSNDDGIPDSTEMLDLNLDIDGDGVSNAWDRDNDGDGVTDGFDLSPFAGTDVRSSFIFDINSTGKPVYLTFQVRPENPAHMRMMTGSYDWPEDDIALMKDLDNSTEDLFINPVLKLICDTPPSQEDVIDYNIIVDGNTCLIPLFLDREYGQIIALRGKMFFPSFSGRIELSLSWSVTAYSDEYVSSIKANDGSFLTSLSDGKVLANSTSTDEGQKFHLEELGNGEIAITDMNGNYLGIDNSDRLAGGWASVEDNCMFTMFEHADYTVIRDHKGRSIINQGNGNLIASNQFVIGQDRFIIGDAGIRSKMINLITYDESISLAGFTASENHGTEIGVLYGDNLDQLILSSAYISNHYLRNNTNSMADIPGLLHDYNIDLSSMRERYSHRDQALGASLTNMSGTAVSHLPEGVALPVITLMEDSSTLLDLSDLVAINGNEYEIDLGNEPVTTLRMMKNTWYRAPSTDPLHPGDVIEEVVSWGYDRETASDAASILCYWCTGDLTVMSVGDSITEWDIPACDLDWFNIGTNLYKSIKWLTGIPNLIGDSLKIAVKIGSKIDILIKAGKAITEGLQSLVKLLKITKIVSVAGDVLKFIDTVLPILDIIGLFIDFGVGVFTVIMTCVSTGWDSFSASVAMARFYIETAYAVVMFLIGLIPVVGTIIGIIMLIADLVDIILTWIPGVSGYQDIIMNWILSLVAGVHMYCELDLEIVTTDFTIDDKTNNGLDAGDRFSIKSLVNTTVTKTKWGSSKDLEEGYIKPSYSAYISSRPELANDTGTKYSGWNRTQTIKSEETVGNVKKTEWDIGTWIEPGFGMVNFPMTLMFYTDYRVFYEEYNYIAFWFPDLWERKELSGYDRTEMETLYFDIMPGTIDDLQHWNYITPSDPDGDTLNETDPQGTDPWKWDTDGDLIGDRYEIDNGMDPLSSDPDKDGLNDRIELELGLDPYSNDTDGDGLSDRLEREGWVVGFMYEGIEFFWHIASDPAMNDTDGDGLSDMMEFLCILNPLSNDTDGDWIDDELVDYITIEVESEGVIGDTPFSLPDCNDIAVDDRGDLYIVSAKNGSLIKLRRDGSFVWESNDAGGKDISSVYVDRYGLIFCGINDYGSADDGEIVVLNPNGTYKGNLTTSHDNIGLWEVENVAVDIHGNIYGIGIGEGELPHLMMLAPNGSWINHRGFGSGNGDDDLHNDAFYGMEDYALAVDSKGRIYIIDPLNERIQILDEDMNFSMSWDISQFGYANDLWIDSEDNIYISDGDGASDRIEMFDRYRRPMDSWTLDADQTSICGGGMYIYVGYETATGMGRIGVYRKNITLHPAEENLPDEDTDGDGLTDILESTGWTINVTLQHYNGIRNVSSSVKLVDTDDDGIPDNEEYDLGTDPSLFDTDLDAIPDLQEILLGTDPNSFDSDGDGLGDEVEVTFGSDPLNSDTDTEGLTDNIEFDIGTDPQDRDTDDDGLTDLEEWSIGWDPKSPDEDGDLMFDGEEKMKGCDPLNGDHDGDGIIDGIERIFDTDPTDGDSDNDSLPDGWELDMRLNPLNNDTDGDGMTDSREIEIGYNPLNKDSDGDGIPDNLDLDFTIDLDSSIIIASDGGVDSFIGDLSGYTPVEEVDPGSIKSEYTDSKYILIIGEPSEQNGTAGWLITELLFDTPDLLENMKNSTEGRCVVRYGIWSPTQTIILLSRPIANDHNRILGILRSLRMTVGSGYLMSDFTSPVGFFNLDSIDVTRAVDTAIYCEMENSTTALIEITTMVDPPVEMNGSSGIGIDQYHIGRFLEIDLNSVSPLDHAEIRIYYRNDDLDRNHDGDSDDDVDIDESTLILYRLEDGIWMDLTSNSQVEGENVTVNGIDYSGYILAEVDRFSIFGITGMTREIGYYDLLVGPVIDEKGDPVEGALIGLHVEGSIYHSETDADGNGIFNLSRELLNVSVTIVISKDGYKDMTYETKINMDGKITDTPPALEKQEEDNTGIVLILLMALVIIAVALMILLVLFRKRDIEDAREE